MACLAALTDDVLTEILLLLRSPQDLARASASCVAFHRIASSPRFLRRFRTLQAPPPLGVFSCSGPDGGGGSQFHPALPPHPSAPAARALACTADFSFAFLPSASSHGAWLVRDCRDGRFLLDRGALTGGSNAFTEVVVCDPLFRRYRVLPPIPDDMAASVENPYVQRGGDGELQQRSSEIFLASQGDEGISEEDPAFTVIWMASCRGKLVAFYYTSESQLWRSLSPPQHYALSTRRVMGVRLGQRNHAHGCFFWMVSLTHRWLVLDTRRMEFSIMDISPVLSGRAMMFSNQITTLESRDGNTTVVVSDLFRPDKRCVLYFYAFMHFSDQWQLMNRTILPEEWGYRFRGIIGAAQGYLFIKLDHPKENLDDQIERNVEYFWLDVKAMRLGSFCRTSSLTINEAYLYCGFPPSLSLPCI